MSLEQSIDLLIRRHGIDFLEELTERFMEMQPATQIAEEIGVPESTVKKWRALLMVKVERYDVHPWVADYESGVKG